MVEEQVIEEHPIFTSCVLTARYLGVNLPRGDAEDLEPNAPMIHADAVLLDYDGVGHIAVIYKIDNNGIYVGEGNYDRGKYTERYIDFDDPAIRGFYKVKSNGLAQF